MWSSASTGAAAGAAPRPPRPPPPPCCGACRASPRTPEYTSEAIATAARAASFEPFLCMRGLLPAGRRGRRHILQLQHVFRIHRLGAAARRLERELFLDGELAQKRVRTGQVMRHVALLALDFRHVLTRVRRDL